MNINIIPELRAVVCPIFGTILYEFLDKIVERHKKVDETSVMLMI